MARTVAVALGAAAAVGFVAWERTHPSAFPYSQRLLLDLAHPVITRDRLETILAPAPGERMLEVGPGTGYYTIPVAERLGERGRLDVVDVQREMLDHTQRLARERGLQNVLGECADARSLPYPDASFDAAFLVTVLGEVPDQDAGLRQLRRVLRPGGRLVVGENILDPHVVSLRALRRRAEGAELRFERASGNPLGYFARFSAV